MSCEEPDQQKGTANSSHLNTTGLLGTDSEKSCIYFLLAGRILSVSSRPGIVETERLRKIMQSTGNANIM